MSGETTPIDVENASALYEDIKSEFSNIGDKDYFLKNIGDPAKRSGLYKALVKKGYDVGTAEQFDKSLLAGDGAPAGHARARPGMRSGAEQSLLCARVRRAGLGCGPLDQADGELPAHRGRRDGPAGVPAPRRGARA